MMELQFPTTHTWLAPKEAFAFQDEMLVVLKQWSFLQNDILNRHWQTKIVELKTDIISIFTQPSNADDVSNAVVMLRNSTHRSVRCLFFTPTYKKAVEELLTIRQASLMDKEDDESMLTFEKGVDTFLANWSDLQSLNDSFKFIKTDFFIPDLLSFCYTAKFDANVDGFAKTISNAIRRHCGETVEVSCCREVAEQLFIMHNDYLKAYHKV